MVKLYHISEDVSYLDRIFTPRVPICCAKDEDNSTPRICFSTSIENCMRATSVSTYCRGVPLVVFEMYVDEDDPNLIYPDELFYGQLVPDALENEEYWYTKSVELHGTLYEVIENRHEISFAWKCIKKKDIISYLQSLSHIDKYFETLSKSSLSNVHEYYERAMEFMDEKKYYEQTDNLWDYVAELPWAQSYKITDLRLKAIS